MPSVRLWCVAPTVLAIVATDLAASTRHSGEPERCVSRWRVVSSSTSPVVMLVPATDQARRSLSAPRTAVLADARTCSGSCSLPFSLASPSHLPPAACAGRSATRAEPNTSSPGSSTPRVGAAPRADCGGLATPSWRCWWLVATSTERRCARRVATRVTRMGSNGRARRAQAVDGSAGSWKCTPSAAQTQPMACARPAPSRLPPTRAARTRAPRGSHTTCETYGVFSYATCIVDKNCLHRALTPSGEPLRVAAAC